MADVTLSASVRSSLLSLQKTSDLISRTQGRLSTGLKVSSPIDDPVAYFQGKTLSDRASDMREKKDGIAQGISNLSAALDGIDAIESIVRQMKGLAQSMKSATNTQIANLVDQFNELRTQINNQATDTTYQGLNLIAGTSESLTVSFSDDSASSLTVNGVNLSAATLGVLAADTSSQVGLSGSQLYFTYASASDVILTHSTGATGHSAGTTKLSLTLMGSTDVTLSANSVYTFKYGGETLSIATGSASVVLSAGEKITLNVYAALNSSSTAVAGLFLASGTSLGIVMQTGAYTGLSAGMTYSAYKDVGDVERQDATMNLYGNTTAINDMIDDLDTALETLRTNAQTLGSNVALLQTRLDFTEKYVNTLEEGSSKLVLADINEEGANLLALQTRQQLGVTALSIAGQQEQGVLSLFR